MSAQFDSLLLRDWQQIHKIELAFHDELTILTGANGSGKSTILRLLAQTFGGWNVRQLRTLLETDKKSGEFTFAISRPSVPYLPPKQEGRQVGVLTYTDNSECKINEPSGSDTPTYNFKLQGSRPASGLLIPASRSEFSYQSLGNIPGGPQLGSQAFTGLENRFKRQIQGQRNNRTTLQDIKQTLISLAVFGFGRGPISPNSEAKEAYLGFRDVLRDVIPDDIGFHDFDMRSGAGKVEVVLDTASGEFLLDAVSGGLASIITMTWLLFARNKWGDAERFCVLIDEPENHLHPGLQRSVLPNFVEAFPDAQFVVATHSPFIVGSNRSANVYAFQFIEGDVHSKKLDLKNRAGTASEILQDVFGLDSTAPIWVEQVLQNIAEVLSREDATPEEAIENLDRTLRERGLEEWFPVAADRLIDEVDNS